jgi:hypothetical protein
MFDIKRKNLFYILILFSLLIKLSFQQFLFPININFDDDDEEEEEKEKENNVKTYDDGLKPIYETKVYKYYDNGTPVTVTHISYKSGNLLGKNKNTGRSLLTPFDIMRSFDRKLNSIFDDFFRESIGIRHILSEMDKDEEEFEKRIARDFFGDNNNDKKNKLENKKEDTDNKDKKEDDDDNNNKLVQKEKNTKRFGKLNIDEEKMKNTMNKKRKKLSRKQLIFSRVCKYIFYSIVLFTVYILVKKLLEFLDIIDPDDFIEVKINNEPDEESINLKKSENKQN